MDLPHSEKPWRVKRKIPAGRLSAAALLGLSVAGCIKIGEDFQRGYIIDERAVSQVRPGMNGGSGAEDARHALDRFHGRQQELVLISQLSNRRVRFLTDTIQDQRVTAVYFNQGLRVERVALYGIEDGKVFDFITRTTPSGGSDQNFLGQLFRGLETFRS